MDTSKSPPGSQTSQEAREEEITRRAVSEMKAGLGRPATELLAEMRERLTERHRQRPEG